MLALFNNFALQNRFAPLPKSLHLAFCALASLLFIVLYLRHKRLNDLLWLIVCDLTLILQFYGDKTTALAVGICEVILLIFIFIEYLKNLKAAMAKKAAEKAAAQAEEDGEDDLKDIEKAVNQERSKLAPEGGDIVSQAFDDEGPVR